MQKEDLRFDGLVVAEDPPLELINEGDNRGVPGVEQQDLLRGDYSFYVLQIDDDRPLSAQHGGRVRQEGIQDSEIPGRKPRPPHDRVLPRLHDLCLPGEVQEQPWPYPGGLLPQAATDAHAT